MRFELSTDVPEFIPALIICISKLEFRSFTFVCSKAGHVYFSVTPTLNVVEPPTVIILKVLSGLSFVISSPLKPCELIFAESEFGILYNP